MVPPCCYLCAFADDECQFLCGLFSWNSPGRDINSAAFRFLGVKTCLCFQKGNSVCFLATCGRCCSLTNEEGSRASSTLQKCIRCPFSPCLGNTDKLTNECVPFVYASYENGFDFPCDALFMD
eukprot:jgi/Bigna1/63655/fgenesh1_kg.57_\